VQCQIKFSPTISCRPNACRLFLISAISTTRSKILITEHVSKEIHTVPLPKLDICMSARLAGVPPAAKKVCAVSLMYAWLQFMATVGMSHSLLHSDTVAAVLIPFAWPHQWLQICQPLLVGRQECSCVVLSFARPRFKCLGYFITNPAECSIIVQTLSKNLAMFLLLIFSCVYRIVGFLRGWKLLWISHFCGISRKY